MKLSNEARLGIIIFFAALLFVSGIIYLRGINLQKKEYSLTIFYDNVNGLAEGSAITVAGLTIGRVESMRLAGTSIAVEVSIQNKVHLSRDSKALIKSSSIMGGKLIAIVPGVQPQTMQDGDTLTGAYEADLTELTSTLAPISSNVLGILERVNTTFDEKTRNNIQTILADFSKTSMGLNQIVQVEGQKLDYAIGNFAVFSSNLARFAISLDSIALSQKANLDTSMTTIRTVTYRLREASENLKTTTASLDAVIGRIERGEGTLGRLIKDPRMYDHIDSAAINMNLLFKDIRENPSKYVKISVF
ncbi:MAG: MlaD family protein [Ignavibacteriales bacterium]|nr:MlaD family protein [Ignavibacteriales bacterium]